MNQPQPLHPELARLEQQYNRIIDDFESGHLTYESASATISALVVIDGAGCHWGINENGQFTRRQHPDAPPEVLDPAYYVGSQLPPRVVAPGQAPWAPSDMTAPPLPGAVAPLPPAAPVGPPAAQIDAPRHLGEDEHRKLPGGGIVAKLAAQRRLFIALGAALGVIGLVLTSRSPAKIPTDTSTTQVPQSSSTTGLEAPMPTDPGATSVPGSVIPTSAVPTTAAPTTVAATAVPTTAAPAVPSPDDAVAAAAALTSGKRDTAAGVIAEPGDLAAIALQTAAHAGLTPTGLAIKGGPIAPGAPATQEWQLVDTQSDTVLSTATISWVKGLDGRWKLSAWPAWQRT